MKITFQITLSSYEIVCKTVSESCKGKITEYIKHKAGIKKTAIFKGINNHTKIT